MELLITGCKDCPFFIEERDLHKCYHPQMRGKGELGWTYGKDVYKEWRDGRFPDFCPLIIEPIKIKAKFQVYV
jgi:hypothetical protein